MLDYRYIQYLEFPPLPIEILDSISRDIARYQVREVGTRNPETYIWTDSHNQRVNDWCKQNICRAMHWGFQIMTGTAVLHKDKTTLTKINYVIDPGGSNVLTEFFDDDEITKKASYCIDPHRWHIFKADSFHQVINIEPGQTRFAITGRVF